MLVSIRVMYFQYNISEVLAALKRASVLRDKSTDEHSLVYRNIVHRTVHGDVGNCSEIYFCKSGVAPFVWLFEACECSRKLKVGNLGILPEGFEKRTSVCSLRDCVTIACELAVKSSCRNRKILGDNVVDEADSLTHVVIATLHSCNKGFPIGNRPDFVSHFLSVVKVKDVAREARPFVVVSGSI